MTDDEFLNKCVKIIKSSPSSDDAKKKISKLKHPFTNKKIGIDGAEKLYYHCVTNYTITYDIDKYCNNETEYINKINKLW
jgi:hypothetical protein